MRVLIADDSATNRKLLRVSLTSEGMEILEAADGKEALEILQRETVDAIISDILMPRMDGYRLCDAIRKSKKLKTLPFIVYTATYTSPSDEKLAVQLGVDRFLRKPASTEELVGAIRELTAKTRPKRQPKPRPRQKLHVMKEYSEMLVRKLEQKNSDLQKARDELRKLNEELERRVTERTAELESFAYSVSHDLRSPLRAMHGFATVLLEDYASVLDPVGQEHARRIAIAAKRMDDLINDLLAYSRLSRQEFELRPIQVDRILKDVLAQLEMEVQQKGAKIAIEGPFPPILAHAAIFGQVMVNLVSNGIKFVAAGVHPEVRIRSEVNDSGVRLWVEDNGIGIAAEHQERIFRVFERLHGADSYPGTGIGLAIVRKGVERMGGQVGVQSAPGQGSRFWIELAKAV